MIFLDSSDPKEIKDIFAWGIVSGVTTNPLILAREAGASISRQRIREVIAVSRGPRLGRAHDRDREGDAGGGGASTTRGRPNRICIKVPFSEIGLRVLHALATRGVRTNVTCLMCFNQAYLAALAGGTYVCDLQRAACATWATTSRPSSPRRATILDREKLASKIIVGSIRHLMDVNEALAGRRAHRHRAARDPAQDAAQPARPTRPSASSTPPGPTAESSLASEIDVEVFDCRLERVLLVQK